MKPSLRDPRQKDLNADSPLKVHGACRFEGAKRQIKILLEKIEATL